MDNKKCIICGRATKWQYSMDIDLPKFSYCKAHKEVVQMFVILLSTEENFNADKWLENARKNVGKANPKPSPKKRR